MRALLMIALFAVSQVTPATDLGQHTSVRGIVLQQNGIPLANATVYALKDDAMTSPPKETTTDTKGSFEFHDLAPGSFYLDAAKPDDGYVYSLFSFYIMPGQAKPKVEVAPGSSTKGVVIKLGEKAAYIDLLVEADSRKLVNPTLLFIRPDFPGTYQRSITEAEHIPVPPVPFSMSIHALGFAPWSYRDKDGNPTVSLHPGEVLSIRVKLVPLSR